MRQRSRTLALYVVGTAGVVVYAWWASARGPFTATATLAVVGAGLVVVVIGLTRPPEDGPRPGFAGAIGWLVLLVALAGWQLLAYVQEPRSDHPTLSSLTNSALSTHPARAIALTAWLIGGFRMARR